MAHIDTLAVILFFVGALALTITLLARWAARSDPAMTQDEEWDARNG